MPPTFIEISMSHLTLSMSLCPSLKIALASGMTFRMSKCWSHPNSPLVCFISVILVVLPLWMQLDSGQAVVLGLASTPPIMSSRPFHCSMTRPFNGPMQMRSEKHQTWRPGFCMVDGTLIPLASKPGHFGEQFFDCKSNYSLSLMVCAHFQAWITRTNSPPAHYPTKSLHY